MADTDDVVLHVNATDEAKADPEFRQAVREVFDAAYERVARTLSVDTPRGRVRVTLTRDATVADVIRLAADAAGLPGGDALHLFTEADSEHLSDLDQKVGDLPTDRLMIVAIGGGV